MRMQSQELMRGLIPYLLVLISLLIPVNSYSGEWRITPIRIDFLPREKTSSLTVFNEDKIPLSFQVKAMLWTQDENGKDVYEETEDVIFFPKVFSLQPGKDRLIRLGLRNPPPVKEKAYRIYVEEIPSQPKTEGVAVQIALRFGIPVFVKPLKEETKWEITKKGIEKGTFFIEIENRGNHHFEILSIKITGLKGEREVFSKEIRGWYLLSGAKRSYSEKIDECKNIDKLIFTLVTDRFTFSDKIDVEQGLCNL
jgi:fimbrial chaperone protein